mmetsp:Transcript_43050/g.130051  ORF Transcript_43050/g.130051 Transcript_43050/m.130051 type:complete len:250 (-) Transcript_43050:55-804(-)
MGSKHQDFSVAAHEQHPGHHLQTTIAAQMYNYEACDDIVVLMGYLLRSTGFVEGWAFYVETRWVDDSGVLDEVADPLVRWGNLKGRMWRANRLIIDTAIHYMDMNYSTAHELWTRNMAMAADIRHSELIRYAKWPGQATGYMWGGDRISDWRTAYVDQGVLSAAEFHYALLSQGTVPLEAAYDRLRSFADCVAACRQTSDPHARCSECDDRDAPAVLSKEFLDTSRHHGHEHRKHGLEMLPPHRHPGWI